MRSTLEIAWLLVNNGADVSITDIGSDSPLHAAARSGYHDIAELLLGSDARPDIRDIERQAPLHLACGNTRVDVARLLIIHGLDINVHQRPECEFICSITLGITIWAR